MRVSRDAVQYGRREVFSTGGYGLCAAVDGEHVKTAICIKVTLMCATVRIVIPPCVCLVFSLLVPIWQSRPSPLQGSQSAMMTETIEDRMAYKDDKNRSKPTEFFGRTAET